MSTSIDRLLFAAASALNTPEEQRQFLDHACRDDAPLRRMLEDMLMIQTEAEKFFAQPESGEKIRIDSSASDGDEDLGTQIGRYRLIGRIGSGGCGVVYLAEQQQPLRRQVALKIIRLGIDTESVIARFEIERQALALMNHPNIARVLDGGATASGRPYFVMELADGEKITDFCDRKKLNIPRRLELFILVCEAIQHAHQKGIIHRDIKPSNVLVREEDDGRAVPTVIDFGIAKMTAEVPEADITTTRAGQFIGTPAYMSPEQAEGDPDIDTRSDIYSLGALLYELLAGSPPLRLEETGARSVEKIRHLLREGRAAAPSQNLNSLAADELGEIAQDRGVEPRALPLLLAGDLDWIVMKAIEFERQRRYETANGLARDVRRYLHYEPVSARPPSRWYLLRKLVRRNRVTFAAAAVALFGLAGGFGVSIWLFLLERKALHEQARLRVVAEQATTNEVRLREEAKAGDLVAQAAVLVRYNEEEQADRLLAGIPTEKVPLSLEAANTFMSVANWNLSHGKWKVAAERFSTLGKILTSVDMSDSERISFDFLSVATAVCEWGEPGQFEELRQLAVARFANSANPTVAEHVLKATLLKPADAETLAKLKPLGAVLESSLGHLDKSPHLRAWQQFSLALMAYRQGDLQTADEGARRSLAMASNSAPRTVSDRLLLAMIGMKRGDAGTARATLADLRKEVADWMKEPFQITNQDGTLWYNQHAVLILLSEAERMLADQGG